MLRLLAFVGWMLVATTAAAEPVVLKLATLVPEDSPWAEALRSFRKQLEGAHPGAVKIKLFYGGALGEEPEAMMAVKRGRIQLFAGTAGVGLAELVPEVVVLELPFLFDSYEEADYVIDRAVAPMLEKYIEERGITVLLWSENGFRSYGGKFAVRTPADLKGRKIRSQMTPVLLDMHRAFGASPVPIATTEALISLQTGLVDGYDNTPLSTFALSWHTASTHFSVTNHYYQPAVVAINKDVFAALPEPVQRSMREIGQSLVAPLRKEVRAMNTLLIDNLKRGGIAVNILTEAERKPFAALAAQVREKYIKGAREREKALYQAIQKSLADFRAKKK